MDIYGGIIPLLEPSYMVPLPIVWWMDQKGSTLDFSKYISRQGSWYPDRNCQSSTSTWEAPQNLSESELASRQTNLKPSSPLRYPGANLTAISSKVISIDTTSLESQLSAILEKLDSILTQLPEAQVLKDQMDGFTKQLESINTSSISREINNLYSGGYPKDLSLIWWMSLRILNRWTISRLITGKCSIGR